MKNVRTKEAAEAILQELPSVVGASVKEDVYGHPREVHLLVEAGPDAGALARDVRDLLEERLGVPVDQRVISIAQLAQSDPEPDGPREPAAGWRLTYVGLESSREGARTTVQVRLAWRGEEFVGTADGLVSGAGRVRAAAAATLAGIQRACRDGIRLDLDAASEVEVLGRPYVLVAAVASSPLLGRRPLLLAGSQPMEGNAEMAAAFAALKATNRVVERVLRAAAEEEGRADG